MNCDECSQPRKKKETKKAVEDLLIQLHKCSWESWQGTNKKSIRKKKKEEKEYASKQAAVIVVPVVVQAAPPQTDGMPQAWGSLLDTL